MIKLMCKDVAKDLVKFIDMTRDRIFDGHSWGELFKACSDFPKEPRVIQFNLKANFKDSRAEANYSADGTIYVNTYPPVLDGKMWKIVATEIQPEEP